jgi:transposase InsO family protein
MTLSELCREYGISRKTAYKWIERYRQDGVEGLEERSCASHTHPNMLDAPIEQQILEARGKHPTWGPLKLLAWLARKHPGVELCAPSTAGDILRRHGLSVPRRRRSRATPSGNPLGDCDESNKLWCADFKGWFHCGDGTKCYPLTITDAYSRYLVRCQVMPGKTDYEAVLPVFEAAFREYGPPQRIRTDNGPPFASTGLGGLSRLSVWWMSHGIAVERIKPGRPDQNGRHERMHRTLKAETAKPAASSLRAQQRRFDEWGHQYNHERPHEALGQVPPAWLYQASSRVWSCRTKPWDYGDEFETVRAVRGCGQMKWVGKDIQVTSALVGHQVGLKRLDQRYWQVYFREQLLGLLDDVQSRIIRPGKQMKKILALERD